MFSLLFDKDFWILIGCILVIGLLIWAFIKYKSARVMILTVIAAVLCGFTVYAGIYVNSYYSASGGIYGQIQSYFSSVVQVEDLTFTISECNLLQENNTDTYSATIYTTKEVSIDDNATYVVCVNGHECSYQYVTSEYCSAEFGYVFYDTEGQELCSDTLYLRFYFGVNQSRLYVYTKGGSSAAEYWEQYFERNDFVVTIVESESETNSLTITDTEDDSYSLVTYCVTTFGISKGTIHTISPGESVSESTDYSEYYTSNVWTDSVVSTGSTFVDPKLVGVSYWMLEDGTEIDSSYVITEDTTLYACMDYYLLNNYFVVEFDSGYLVGTNSGTSSDQYGLYGLLWVSEVYSDDDVVLYDVLPISSTGYWWTGYSILLDRYCVLSSSVSSVDSVVFDSQTLSLVSDFDNIIFSGSYYAAFEFVIGDCIVYSPSSTGGCYLYNISTEETIQILDEGTVWSSFSTKFNETTGSWSSIIIANSSDDYYIYDVVQETLKGYTEGMVTT